jgi:hydrogenase expression/formation protein HypD
MPIDAHSVAELLGRISKIPLSVMEVCGTHTVSIFRSGVRSILPPTLKLVSGPGCPVCVTDQGEIEAALSLLDRGAVVAAYGDMFKVPCDGGSLASKRSRGLDARVVTSAMDVLAIAGENPEREVVFLGVGFETTAPATAALVREAARRGVGNLSVLSFHKRTPPAVELLAADPDLRLSG